MHVRTACGLFRLAIQSCDLQYSNNYLLVCEIKVSVGATLLTCSLSPFTDHRIAAGHASLHAIAEGWGIYFDRYQRRQALQVHLYPMEGKVI